MIDTREDQPAFPRSYTADGHNGMTLRDYFAGQVIAMLIVHGTNGTIEHEATMAYVAADAMLAERSKASALSEQDQ